MTAPLFPLRPRLCLVEKPPRPRLLEVRIAAADGRAPVGRTKIFRLDFRDFEQLINVAIRLESRR